MVGTGDLCPATIFFVEFDKIVSLQQHIVKFQKRHRLLAFQTRLDAVHGQHPVDGIIGSDIAQKREVIDVFEPIPVVNHFGVRGSGAEFKKF